MHPAALCNGDGQWWHWPCLQQGAIAILLRYN